MLCTGSGEDLRGAASHQLALAAGLPQAGSFNLTIVFVNVSQHLARLMSVTWVCSHEDSPQYTCNDGLVIHCSATANLAQVIVLLSSVIGYTAMCISIYSVARGYKIRFESDMNVGIWWKYQLVC
jgi:hypothetical protein